MAQPKDYSSQDRALVDREERALDRQRARAKAAESSLQDSIANALKNPDFKKRTALEAREATRDPSRLAKMKEYDEGIYKDELVTGFEDKPWEK